MCNFLLCLSLLLQLLVGMVRLVAAGDALLEKELQSARLKADLLSATSRSAGPAAAAHKGDGMVARAATEAVLIQRRIFTSKVCLRARVYACVFSPLLFSTNDCNRGCTCTLTKLGFVGVSLSLLLSGCCRFLQEFPLSAVLDNLEAATAKRAGVRLPGWLYADDLVAYVTDARPHIDSLKFGQPITPVASRPRSSTSARSKSTGVLRIRTPAILKKRAPAPVGAWADADDFTATSDAHRQQDSFQDV